MARWPTIARPGAARRGDHPSVRHYRLQRVATRAHYRRAWQRGRLPQRPHETHQAVDRAPGDELLWCASMPCRLPADDAIPIGRYGISNVGRAKSIYRMGLAHRYGRRMQTISGIHFNFSLPEPLSNEAYFALIRNFRRHSWLLLYLFGASPAVCTSFVADRAHELVRLSRGYVLPALRDLAAHGSPGMPERRADLARGELQQPRQLRYLAPGGAHQALSGLRGNRHPRPATTTASSPQLAPDRTRVLRDHPAQTGEPAAETGHCTSGATAVSIRGGSLAGPRSTAPVRVPRARCVPSRSACAAWCPARPIRRRSATILGDTQRVAARGRDRDCVSVRVGGRTRSDAAAKFSPVRADRPALDATIGGTRIAKPSAVPSPR